MKPARLADATWTQVRALVEAAPATLLVPLGATEQHGPHLPIGAACTELLLVELGRSASETFDRVLFVNAHGGNTQALSAAVGRLRHEGRDARYWTPSWEGDAHAGRTETSLMLAIGGVTAGACVDAGEPGNTAPIAQLINDLRADGVRAHSPNGVLGDPRGASAAEGRLLLAAAAGDLCATLVDWPAEVAEIR